MSGTYSHLKSNGKEPVGSLNIERIQTLIKNISYCIIKIIKRQASFGLLTDCAGLLMTTNAEKEKVTMQSLNELLKEKADVNGLDNHQLSEALSISEYRLENILSGAERCTPDELRKISDVFSCPIIDLYIAAGYLQNEDVEQYQRVFIGTEKLSETERVHIQEMIYMLEKNRGLAKEYI